MDDLTDDSGHKLNRSIVEELAFYNVLGSMSVRELARFYVDEMPDVALVQWATDESGNFPIEYHENSGAK